MVRTSTHLPQKEAPSEPRTSAHLPRLRRGREDPLCRVFGTQTEGASLADG
jgi:hypothetical protein